jgi:tRNA (guanine37-N1)-methyltransferase
MFSGPLDESIIKRAKDTGKVTINLHNLRDWATDSYGTVDGKPFGGGAGMVIRVDVVHDALVKIKEKKVKSEKKSRTILLSPQGEQFTQQKAYKLSKMEQIVLICGHYEGFDERVRKHLVDEELSVGPYVLTGGELPAMVMIDAITRLIPGVIRANSLVNESFSKKKSALEHPQYTHPREYKGWKVPEVLLSGDHGKIKGWKERNRKK